MREAQPMRSSWEPDFTALPDRCCGPKAEVYAQLVRIGSIQALAELTMSINRKLTESVCYFTAPAVRPLTMCFSMIRPITINGVIAAVASAAIDHQRVPCELVCPANRSGKVGESAPASTTAKKYSFQEKTRDRMNAATNPGAAMGTTMRRNACQIEAPSTRAACSSSTGIELNWSRMIQITIGRFIIVYTRTRPVRVSRRSSSRYRTRSGKTIATGGRISCERNQNDMSLFRHGPKRYENLARPYAANEPMIVANAAALSEIVTVLAACFKKSSRALDG